MILIKLVPSVDFVGTKTNRHYLASFSLQSRTVSLSRKGNMHIVIDLIGQFRRDVIGRLAVKP